MFFRLFATLVTQLIHLHVFSLVFLTCIFSVGSVYGQSKASQYQNRDLDSLHSISQLRVRNFQNREFIQSPQRLPPVTSLPSAYTSSIERLQQTLCYDTSERFYLKNDSIVFYTYDGQVSKDGNLLISGEYAKWSGDWDYKGFLLKTDPKGNIIWLNTYDSLYHTMPFHQISYYKMQELKDGSIFLIGITYNYQTQNEDVICTKTDASGNIIWSKIYKSRLWTFGSGSADYYYAQQIKEDPKTGEIYICGKFWGVGKGLTKMNSINGDLIWSRSYDVASNGYGVFDSPFGIDIRDDEIRYFGKFLWFNTSVVSIYRINKITGDTLQTKFFIPDNPLSTKLGFLTHEPLVLLANGNYALSGRCYGEYQYPITGTTPFYQAAVAEFDANLNFVRAYAYTNYIQANGYNTKATVFPDGSALFTMLHYISSYNADVFFVQTTNTQITRQRKLAYRGQGIPQEPPAFRHPEGGDLKVRMLGDSATNTGRIEYLRLQVSDTSSDCLGIDDASFSLYPFQYKSIPYYFDSLRSNLFQENPNKSLTVEHFSMEKFRSCDRVSHCNSLELLSPATTICLGRPLQITVRKNKACGSLVPITVNTGIIDSLYYLNDSTVNIQFNKPWSGYIFGSLSGCDMIYDSLFINVLQTPDTLNLGPDKSLCPGNKIQVNAGKGFNTYLWQDGSTDSIITVTSPGWYFVRTTDACGGVYVDSLQVTAAPPIQFSAGPDRVKCNKDTVWLTAQAGFINYTWTNPYNINMTTGHTVIVSPEVDTAYYVQAEKTPGCFAYDTIRVSVYHSPVINLGVDKSICSGDSLVFHAGQGFQSWQWNTNATTSMIVVKTAGQYHVAGTTFNGCKSFDTVSVLNVYPLPAVQLDQDPDLCIGEWKILDAGPFASYQWSTGALSRTIQVGDTGTYKVTVTSAEGCSASGGVSITTLHPTPFGFLPKDSSICTYSFIELKSTRNFQKYLWNTGGSGTSITISKPGLYWLDVTDNNNCKGRDSVSITSKDCMQGFYIPTAFTPNDDYKNDLFKPLLFGRVESFSFTIFNRWGQAIFQTSTLQQGWDGKIGGRIQQSGVFGWICTYKLEGEEQKTQKGTVMLIR